METIQGYYIKTTLGIGGMASVYLGTQKSLDRPVAIKVLNTRLIDDSIIRQQFAQESTLIAHLSHPNIVQVIDQGMTDQGHPYFVMPYVKSITLNTLLKRNDITEARKIDIVIQLCKALAYAHRNGVVHRDIKPGNILVDYDGHVRLVDFGIAGYFSDNNTDKSAQQELIMGTDAYMAPEQKDSAHNASPLSDLYSLGVVMQQLFFGCLPHQIQQPKTTDSTANNSEHAREFHILIDSCIHPSPKKRPASADDIRQTLLLIVQGKHLKTNRWNTESRQDNIPANYKLLDVLKENPFGATYLVNDPKHERLLVIKKQRLDQMGNAHLCATRLMHIQHPHLVRIYGSGKNNRVSITASEYCPAGNLQDRLTQSFNVGQWMIIAQQLYSALAFAHAHGITHGNLRPSNIVFAENNHLKISDFGFPAHTYGDDSHWYHLHNEPTATTTSDVYAAGAILFQLLIKKIPSHQYWGIKNWWALRHVQKPLRTLILKMIQANPKHRIADANAAMNAFESFNSKQDTYVLNKVII